MSAAKIDHQLKKLAGQEGHLTLVRLGAIQALMLEALGGELKKTNAELASIAAALGKIAKKESGSGRPAPRRHGKPLKSP